MAIDPNNRALRKVLAWLSESDLTVIVWKTDDEVPTMFSVVDQSAEPFHVASVKIMDTEEEAEDGMDLAGT